MKCLLDQQWEMLIQAGIYEFLCTAVTVKDTKTTMQKKMAKIPPYTCPKRNPVR